MGFTGPRGLNDDDNNASTVVGEYGMMTPAC